MPFSKLTHYLNAEFDLGLRPRPGRVEQPALARQVRELSAQAVLGAAPGDAALLRVELPQAFIDHVGDCGLTVPRLLTHPHLDPSSRLRPFGWSGEAMELNGHHEQPVEHPPLETIGRVNARSLGLRFEAEIDASEPIGEVVESVDDLCAFMAAMRASPMSLNREPGSRCRQRSSNRRIARGVSAGNAPQSSSLRITAASVSEIVSPSNSRRPASISNSKTPNDQISARRSTVLPLACSGLM